MSQTFKIRFQTPLGKKREENDIVKTGDIDRGVDVREKKPIARCKERADVAYEELGKKSKERKTNKAGSNRKNDNDYRSKRRETKIRHREERKDYDREKEKEEQLLCKVRKLQKQVAYLSEGGLVKSSRLNKQGP